MQLPRSSPSRSHSLSLSSAPLMATELQLSCLVASSWSRHDDLYASRLTAARLGRPADIRHAPCTRIPVKSYSPVAQRQSGRLFTVRSVVRIHSWGAIFVQKERFGARVLLRRSSSCSPHRLH